MQAELKRECIRAEREAWNRTKAAENRRLRKLAKEAGVIVAFLESKGF